uniref:Uncharacterized protein n=1 Tax=Ditylenchus dipsaci TaxID=166011 RepID=A0A915DTQ4_9BILA
MIVGIVIGIVALLAVSVVIFFLVKYIRAKKSQESNVEQGKHVEGADGSKRSMSNSAAFSKSEGVIVVKTCISPTSDEDVQPKSSKKSGAKAISKSQQLSSNAKASAQPSKSKKINTLPEQIPSVSELFPQLSSDKVMKSDNSISGSLVGDIRDQVKETRKKTKRKKLQKEKAPGRIDEAR